MHRSAARLVIGTRGRLAASARACDGTTAVETALVLPAFLLFIFAIIEAGFLLWTQTTLQFAVEAAARYASINTTASASAIQTYAASQAVGMTISSSSFSVIQPPTASSCGGYQVSINYPFNFIVSHLFTNTITLKANSCHP
jgi:Flp pilus assembly protein TadG